MESYTVTYSDGKMKVSHPSGFEEEYTTTDLIENRAKIYDIRNQLDLEIILIDIFIAGCEGSR